MSPSSPSPAAPAPEGNLTASVIGNQYSHRAVEMCPPSVRKSVVSGSPRPPTLTASDVSNVLKVRSCFAPSRLLSSFASGCTHPFIPTLSSRRTYVRACARVQLAAKNCFPERRNYPIDLPGRSRENKKSEGQKEEEHGRAYPARRVNGER